MNSLKISLLICDGASTNLPAAKATHGHTGGAYGVQPGQIDPFEVKPFFVNPFDPPNLIYWLICPSHQVCVINAILNSLWCVA